MGLESVGASAPLAILGIRDVSRVLGWSSSSSFIESIMQQKRLSRAAPSFSFPFGISDSDMPYNMTPQFNMVPATISPAQKHSVLCLRL